MKVYVDLIFITNFFIDLLILIGLSKVLKYKIKLIRLIISTLFGTLSMFLLFISMNIYILNIIKLIISIAMIIICFGRKQIIKKLIYFYLISIILGGVIYLIKLNISTDYTIVFLFIISPIIIYLYIKEQLSYKINTSPIYNVCLLIDDKKYELRGLLDTGNSLIDPYKKRSVILLNNNIHINKSRFIMIPYKTINYEGIVKCIKPDKVIINNIEFNNCLIGLVNNKLGLDIDCILPNKFREDL